jgi:aryl-alcohol dehydrogenase-like predicted oxidoreductase
VSTGEIPSGASNRARLSIGTAQFGLRYGIANRHGQMTRDEARAVLDAARGGGIDTLDTAIAYGDSEQTLGGIGIRGWRVTTKLPPLPATVGDVRSWVREAVEASLSRLRLDQVHGLLLHRPADLHEGRGDELSTALREVLDSGRAKKIGVSIYRPDELETLVSRLPLGIVQSPFNIFDRRLENSGWLRRLTDGGVEVHTRSAFLQGMLLMEPAARPSWTARWQALFARWDAWLAHTGMGAAQACLGFVLSRTAIARAVIGVDGRAQLEELLAYASVSVEEAPNALSSTDSDLLDPSRWPKT